MGNTRAVKVLLEVLILQKQIHLPIHRVCDFWNLRTGFVEVNTIPIVLSGIADVKKWSFPCIEVKASNLEAFSPFSPSFCACTGRVCFKAMNFNFYPSLVPRLSVGILKHGTIGVLKGGYIPSFSLQKMWAKEIGGVHVALFK